MPRSTPQASPVVGAISPVSAPLAALIARWREQAAAYEEDGQPAAFVLRRVAQDLDETVRQWLLEQITPAQAAQEQNCHASTIRRRFPGRRRISREEVLRECVGGPDLAGAILAAHGAG
jgi:hypothetical protein